MYLEIVTPDEKVFEGEVVSVSLPGIRGTFQILNNHAPLISALEKGKVLIKGEKDQELTIDGGVAEVLANKVVVLAEGLIKEDDLNLSK